MVLCVLAAGIPQLILNAALPDLWFLWVLVGAGCAMFAIMATCGMGAKRAGITAGIYFAVQIAIRVHEFTLVFRT